MAATSQSNLVSEPRRPHTAAPAPAAGFAATNRTLLKASTTRSPYECSPPVLSLPGRPADHRPQGEHMTKAGGRPRSETTSQPRSITSKLPRGVGSSWGANQDRQSRRTIGALHRRSRRRRRQHTPSEAPEPPRPARLRDFVPAAVRVFSRHSPEWRGRGGARTKPHGLVGTENEPVRPTGPFEHGRFFDMPGVRG